MKSLPATFSISCTHSTGSHPACATPQCLQDIGTAILASGTPLAVFQPDDTMCFASDSFRALYHVQPGCQTFESIMRHCFLIQQGPRIESDDIDGWLSAAQSKRRSLRERTFEVDFHDGRWMWATETTLDGGWVVFIVLDFTPVKYREFAIMSARDRALVAAETDSLTGTLNRGAIMSRLAALLTHTETHLPSLLIILIDLDHFKAINDRHGHDTGDIVLQHFCTCCQGTMRSNDMLARIGGEEFLILMRNISVTQAASMLDRLRDILQQQPLSTEHTKLRYTFSAGVARWDVSQTLEQLYHAADQALYAAKVGGRNRTCIAS